MPLPDMTINIRDIVLAPFPFTDLSNSKLRPALVLFVEGWNITLVFITSNLLAIDDGDIIIEPDNNNRLRNPSLFKITKLCTIDNELIELKYGTLSKKDFARLCKNLVDKINLGISFP